MNNAFIKRLFDLVVATVGVLLLLPVWAIVAVVLKFDSKGSVLYRATRIGRNGEPFTLLKFRTLLAVPGPRVTCRNDPRMTRVGRHLRHLKLDETPQLLNVLRGEMSLVGPRPEDPKYVAAYTPEQRRILQLRPGLISPAVVKYRHEETVLAAADDPERAYVEEILPEKLEMDLSYAEERSFFGDLRLLFSAARSIATLTHKH
jgi:lipopolysaccharide/colanic/teichoic acid biosynthesis glycosyltransferase